MEAVLVEALASLPLVAGGEVDADDEVAVLEAGASAGDAQLVQRLEVLGERLEALVVRNLQAQHGPQAAQTPVALLTHHRVAGTKHLRLHYIRVLQKNSARRLIMAEVNSEKTNPNENYEGNSEIH